MCITALQKTESKEVAWEEPDINAIKTPIYILKGAVKMNENRVQQ